MEHWEFKSDEPIYLQVVRLLEYGIISGTYPAGTRLASVRDIAAKANINPNTVQRALAELEARGLIVTQSTNGRFVTQDKETFARLKKQTVDYRSQEYLKELESLGLTKNEIREKLMSMIKECEKK